MHFENTFQTLQDNKAKYHKTCRFKYDSQKKMRTKAKICKLPNVEKIQPPDTETSISTRSKNPQSSDILHQQCLFWEIPETAKENLVSVSTLKIGPDIHRYAALLRDETLMKKLHSTDLVAMEAKYHKL